MYCRNNLNYKNYLSCFRVFIFKLIEVFADFSKNSIFFGLLIRFFPQFLILFIKRNTYKSNNIYQIKQTITKRKTYQSVFTTMFRKSRSQVFYKIGVLRPAMFLKKDFSTDDFIFYRTPQMTAFELLRRVYM